MAEGEANADGSGDVFAPAAEAGDTNPSDSATGDDDSLDGQAADSLVDVDAGESDGCADGSTCQLLLSAGQGCLECANEPSDVASSCLTQYNCEALAGHLSDAGESREDLCLQTLRCVLSTNCAPPLTACYCGDAAPVPCEATDAANGVCLQAEQAGLETTNPLEGVGVQFYDASLGGGVSNKLVQCLVMNRCDCFH
jgi:hypothetical protein